MKKLHFRLTAGLAALLLLATTRAGTLKEDATEAGLDWIIGNWGDKTTNGATIRINYEWRLDGHAVGVKVFAPDRNAEGLIARDAKTRQIGYVAVDNQGGGAMGKVVPDAGTVIIKLAYSDGGSEQGKMAITHAKGDANTMKLTISEMSDSGEVLGTKQALELVRIK